MVERVRVRTDEVVTTAVRELTRALTDVDRVRGRSRLAIAGGSAANVMKPFRESVSRQLWSRVSLTWVDERCVPFADPASNRGAVYASGGLTTEHRPARELPLFLDHERPDVAARRVRASLLQDFDGGLDVLLLGLGEDGHVASLFPAHRALAATGGAVAVHDSPKPPSSRISLTLDVLAAAPRCVLVVQGSAKAAALARVMAGDPALPTSRLRGHVTIITDIEE